MFDTPNVNNHINLFKRIKMSLKEEINKNGWVIAKNIFNSEEINKFRELALKDADHQGDLLSSQFLSDVITDNRLLDIIKECLGTESLYYFGDSSVSMNVSTSGFHKDSRDRENVNSQEFKDIDYSLLRIGIYLQDHTTHSKGLCLRDKSHLIPQVSKGKIINVKTEAGDVILWKLTTTHSANADILSLFPNLALNPKITKLIPEVFKLKATNPRIALFACFGKEDNYSELYIDYLKTRSYAVKRWEQSTYTDENILKMKKNNVLVDTSFDVKNIDSDSVHDGYVQL